MLLWVHTTTNLMSVHIPLSCYTRSKHNEVNIVVLFLVVLLDIVSPIILFFFQAFISCTGGQSVSESRASLAAFRVCAFDSNDCVMLFSENKYDDDDDFFGVSGPNVSKKRLLILYCSYMSQAVLSSTLAVSSIAASCVVF